MTTRTSSGGGLGLLIVIVALAVVAGAVWIGFSPYLADALRVMPR